MKSWRFVIKNNRRTSAVGGAMLTAMPTWRAVGKNLSATQYAAFDAVVQIVAKAGRDTPCQKLFTAAQRRRGKDAKSFISVTTPNGNTVTRLELKADDAPFARLESLRKAVQAALALSPRTLALDVYTDAAPDALYAALIAAARLPGQQPTTLKKITLAGATARRVEDAAITAKVNTVARRLIQLPPNQLSPEIFARITEACAKRYRLTVKPYSAAALKRMGAGAILAVGAAAPSRPPMVMRVSYRPREKRRVALVGKGVCYDTGGVNVKPPAYMRGMRKDMAGAATALAALLGAAEKKLPIGIDAWLVLAENNIGPEAYRPDDVITALNGKTIEIIHTDAEGRMLLADTLTLASREKPALLVTYATLTGAMHVAVGERMSGFFATADKWRQRALDAADESGERLCYFPAPEDYKKDLSSDCADIKQCANIGNADHIHAALFLKEFIEGKPPWLHLDLSAASHDGGLGAAPGPVTGFGVAWTLALLSAWKK